jgi:hypothetical protein
MQIEISTDHTVRVHEESAEKFRGQVEHILGHLKDRITRVEVHLSDENGRKGGEDDKRCSLEARVQGRPPAGVTHHANSFEDALTGAAQKLKRSLESSLGKLQDRS